jgi:hypothetical protein
MGDYLTSPEAILAFDDVQIHDEPVPEWGGTVRLRSLSGRDRDLFDASIRERHGGELVATFDNITAKLVARSIIDPDTGERVFSDEQIAKLGEKNAAVLNRLYDIAARLSGMRGQEAMAGNSEAAPSGGSGSSSPES